MLLRNYFYIIVYLHFKRNDCIVNEQVSGYNNFCFCILCIYFFGGNKHE